MFLPWFWFMSVMTKIIKQTTSISYMYIEVQFLCVAYETTARRIHGNRRNQENSHQSENKAPILGNHEFV